MIEYLNYSGLSHFFDKLKAFFAKKTQSIKNISRNGTTFTATRADGSTFTFDQQTPAAATTTTAGLMPPLNQNSSTYLDGTGNWTTPPYPQAVNTQRAGLVPTLSGNSNTYLNGNGYWTTPTPQYPLVSEYGPGAMPALNGNLDTYLDGTGQWSIPVSPLATEYMQGSIPALNGDSTTFLNGMGAWTSATSTAQVLAEPRLKFFRLANGGSSNSLTLIFSQPPGSSDMFFVFGRANGDGGWNNSGTMIHGLITFEDAYDTVQQGAPVVLLTSRSGNGNFSINRTGTVVYQLRTGPYARLWFLTTSEYIMVQESIQASESP